MSESLDFQNLCISFKELSAALCELSGRLDDLKLQLGNYLEASSVRDDADLVYRELLQRLSRMQDGLKRQRNLNAS